MIDSGGLLIVLLVAILALFRWRMRRQDFDGLLDRDLRFHHRVHAAMAKLSRGGTWKEYKQAMAEEEETDKPEAGGYSNDRW